MQYVYDLDITRTVTQTATVTIVADDTEPNSVLMAIAEAQATAQGRWSDEVTDVRHSNLRRGQIVGRL